VGHTGTQREWRLGILRADVRPSAERDAEPRDP
jgi:hypothetical protein